MIDGTGAEPSKQTVVIRGDRIEAVAPKIELTAGTRVIEAEGMTLMPGLFDLHTHLPYSSVSGVLNDWPKNLKAYLYCGVTSVVDFGAYGEMFEPMRSTDQDRRGRRASHQPGRADNHSRRARGGGRARRIILAGSFDRVEARAAVRRALSYQPDVIKAFTDGWRYGAAPDMSNITRRP